MIENFKDFRKKEEQPAVLINEDSNKKIIRDFIIKKTGITENGLVSLVILYNTGNLNEDYREELEIFGLVNDSKITEKGETYLNDPKTIEKLKSMI